VEDLQRFGYTIFRYEPPAQAWIVQVSGRPGYWHLRWTWLHWRAPDLEPHPFSVNCKWRMSKRSTCIGWGSGTFKKAKSSFDDSNPSLFLLAASQSLFWPRDGWCLNLLKLQTPPGGRCVTERINILPLLPSPLSRSAFDRVLRLEVFNRPFPARCRVSYLQPLQTYSCRTSLAAQAQKQAVARPISFGVGSM
jgi:hypothetical protein